MRTLDSGMDRMPTLSSLFGEGGIASFEHSTSHFQFRAPRFNKITKRTHFMILNCPVTTTIYPRPVRNRPEKRTHFGQHYLPANSRKTGFDSACFSLKVISDCSCQPSLQLNFPCPA